MIQQTVVDFFVYFIILKFKFWAGFHPFNPTLFWCNCWSDNGKLQSTFSKLDFYIYNVYFIVYY